VEAAGAVTQNTGKRRHAAGTTQALWHGSRGGGGSWPRGRWLLAAGAATVQKATSRLLFGSSLDQTTFILFQIHTHTHNYTFKHHPMINIHLNLSSREERQERKEGRRSKELTSTVVITQGSTEQTLSWPLKLSNIHTTTNSTKLKHNFKRNSSKIKGRDEEARRT